MKKMILAILLFLVKSYSSYSQIYTDPNTNYVGIGTTSPATLLTLRDPTIASDALTGTTTLKFDSGNGGGGIGFEKESLNTGGLRFYTQYGFGSMVEQMRITSDGKFGIGISNPTSKLVVASALKSNSIDQTFSIVQNDGTTAYGGYLGQRVVSANIRQGLIVSAGGSLTMNAQNYNIDFITGAITPTDDTNLRMRIASNGYVGIGTPNPDKELAVNGTIHATEVLVDQTVPHPDYVFDKDYDLTPLKDIKTYIDQNHHLPEIPSAAQVTKEGINLGEMNAMLLKKIEELTLYLIEKDKQLKAQQKQLNKIKRAIKLK